MSGPGGPDVYSLPAAGSASPQLVMAFAAWQGSTIGYLDCGIRPMYLADLSFEPNGGAGHPGTVARRPRRDARREPVLPDPGQAGPWILASRL